jgi:hypothetical protein
MRRALLVAAVALAGCGGSGHTTPGELAVQRAALRPGTIDLFVHNGSAEPATLAQVQIDSGFVGFDGPPQLVAPNADAVLTVTYPWVAGVGYRVKVLTGSGETLAYRIAAH